MKKYVIFTGGKVRFSKKIKEICDTADIIIAADQGAKTAIINGYTPSVVLGDFDSLDKKTLVILKRRKVKCIVLPEEKDETDTEIAIQYAIKRGAKNIDIVGGIEGDRIDHIIANIILPTSKKIPIRYLNGNIVAWLGRGPTKINELGNEGDLLSIIPLSKIVGVTTSGLKYPLTNEKLILGRSRGISNVFERKNIIVEWKKGLVFFVHIYNAN